MQFGILGPLEVRADGRAVMLGGAKPRAVLAVLALHANQSVSAERLAVALWGEDVPPSAVKTVQVYVARLRKALGDPDRLVTTPAGYSLRVGPGELDAERFERLLGDGRRALKAGRGDDAAAELRQALDLWRGPPLAELASAPFAPAEITRLEEQHLAAVELRVDADLAAGRHAELVGELQQLTARQPWRERLHAQLMLALYRSGRQADALEAYRHAREVLVEQLGIEPGAELHELHEAILAHDPAIAAAARSDERGDGSLPAPPNQLIGRRRELADIGERLRSSSGRMLTLTGPGGVGKTRLALEAARAVAADFADGARLVQLAAVSEPEAVPAAIVRALGIVVLAGESPGQAAERFLAAKHLLLVADNFEHVLAAAPCIGDLLGACPSLTVLATSREPLALQAEERYPVAPLELRHEAVALFAERARAHDPEFALGDGNAAPVAEICRRVDGLPLAIELAAARCGLLSPGEIAARLDAALGAPGAAARDAPARHRTLGATIDWSHALLSADEQRCFARFAVFAGGATVAAAETITGGGLDTLDGLVTKSLLTRRRDTPTRLGMLETIRAYAAERFASAADVDAVREAHYRYCLGLAERHGTDRALRGSAAREHVATMDADNENLHAALVWAVAKPSGEPALAMVAALGGHWITRNRYADVVNWADQALDLPAADPALTARVLRTKGRCLWMVGRMAEQPATLAAAEAAARLAGDPVLLSQVLQSRVHHETDSSRPEIANAFADEALSWARLAGDDWELAEASRAKAIASPDVAELRRRVDAAAALLTAVGNVQELAGLFSGASYSALCLGSDRDAAEYAARAISTERALDDPYGHMIDCGNLGLAALLTGEPDTASRAFREELALCREMVIRPVVFEGLRGLAAVAVVHGDDARAATLVGAADVHRYAWPEDPIEARLDRAFFDGARTRCGADAWNAATHQGGTLSFEDAIAYALGEVP
ncbi:BTAD domain-containing putative transcriptional regulator [Solirubrobacter soli]|uniref:BTAD domain-containing putative transcriptional regulator n=1 Tax=Solirubrobacter soli TaxID=363832 RepID=UPI00040495EB|nr:BTAD domain-containing putative transcriptional regulator [Solirubrobacter soli]